MSDVVRSFKLSPTFLASYEGKQPSWGPVGYITYKRTYARKKDDGRTEEFWETCKRVVEGCYQAQKKRCFELGLEWNNAKAQNSAQEMFRRMWEFKWLPPGRGLWMMGTEHVERTGAAALNNPLHADTPILTKKGWCPIGNLAGDTVEVLSSTKLYGRDHESTAASPVWVEAKISDFEEQPCVEIVTRDIAGVETKIVASVNHRWFRRETTKKPWERVTSWELSEGDYLPIVRPVKNYPLSVFGAQHGFFFGDGTRSNGELHQFGDSVHVLKDLFGSLAQQVTHRRDDEWVVRNCPRAWADIPDVSEDTSYIWGFLAGYFAADGCVSKQGSCSLSSARREELQTIKRLFTHVGVRTGSIRLESTSSNYAEERELWKMPVHNHDLSETFFLKSKHRDNWGNRGQKYAHDYAKVVSIKHAGTHRVLCATVPDKEQFVIDGFILTSNCGFVSTAGIAVDLADPFCWLMDMLMLGVGVGFDTKGAGLVKVQEPRRGDDVHVVEDSREGWVELLRRVITAYAGRGSLPGSIDYSLVRPMGSPIRGFGGTASGPDPLDELVTSVQEVLNKHVGEPISGTAIVDICNLVGRCVVAGNVRRSAEIAFGNHDDEVFLDLKNTDVWGEEVIYHHRWASNNSIFAEVGMDYTEVARRTAINGEPGYEWLDNARAYGRMGRIATWKDRRVAGANPCVEQSLEDRELCCVSADTRILTRTGYPQIADVVGTPVEVWNGRDWSVVTPFLAARGKKLYRVTLSDGSYIDVTDNHGWSVRTTTQRKFRRVPTIDLTEGMILERCEPPTTRGGTNFADAYQAGWICGDGFIDGKKVMALVQEPEYSVLPELGGLGKVLRDSGAGLPEEMFSWDAHSIAEFMAGWIDTDGTVRQQENTDNYVLCSTSEKKLRDAQLLLRKIGVNYATLHKWADAGHKTNYGERNKDLWSLFIPSFEAMNISPRLKPAFRFGDRLAVNNAQPTGALIDRARRQKIVSIQELPGEHNTYCFTEPFEHKGVFGNCLTYQCLVETFPGNHNNYEDYQKTLKYAYLYAKSVTLIATHDTRTNQVLLRNRRIGTSMSGIVQAVKKHGRREFFRWCDSGYNYLRELDQIYSDWLCVRESIKITSVKPSGTVSLLPGVTPGIHFPHSEYYIRRIRFNEHHPLVDILRENGYHVEEDKYSPNTVVAEFPIHEEMFDRSKDEVSMWEQLELAAQMQQFWADNQVSVTVTFKAEEAKDIKYALELYEVRLKGVSFLPLQDHGYVQAPYEAITEAEYEERVRGVTPIHSGIEIVHDTTERFCSSDSCIVEF